MLPTKRSFNLSFWTDSPYVTGDQSHADELWNAITSDGGHLGFISIDGRTRRWYDLKTVSLVGDTEKYLVGLDVFHQLHCLNYLRKRLLGRNLTHVQDPLGDKHIPHCLESLRLSLQCSADLSLLPLRWNHHHRTTFILLTSGRMGHEGKANERRARE